MEHKIYTQAAFDEAIEKGVDSAKIVMMHDLPKCTSIPDLPSATDVELNLPKATEIPALVDATDLDKLAEILRGDKKNRIDKLVNVLNALADAFEEEIENG